MKAAVDLSEDSLLVLLENRETYVFKILIIIDILGLCKSAVQMTGHEGRES